MSMDIKDSISNNIIQQIKKIKNNNIDSSVTIAHQAIDVYFSFLNNKLPSDFSLLKKSISYIGLKLIFAQEEMALIFNLVNNILKEIEKTNNSKDIINSVKTTCTNYKKKLINANNKISIRTNDKIKHDYSILTHSFSETVFITLLKAKNLGKNVHVYVTESRPKNEGVILAKKLIKEDISTTLIVDSAVYEILPKIDMILVGADKISSKFVVNKIGTYGLALSANQKNIPCYVLCSFQKFIPMNKN